MELRSASADDAHAIAEIHVGGWRAAYRGLMPDTFLATLSVEKRESGWRTALERGEPAILVAVDADRIAGWIAYGKCRDDDQPAATGEVWAIYSRCEYWNNGLDAFFGKRRVRR